ncbi:MAG TPA: GC-type dockerin domain-anchored protein [Phycisphaerales bacterium]|nr:GC-type dockerin domain-anchored protein [Phycisphaerales bacterium]
MTKPNNLLARWGVVFFASVVAASASTAPAQEAFGITGPPAGAWPPVQVVPLSKAHGVGVGAVPALVLEALDNAQLAAQADAAPREGKPRMVGVARPIALDASMGVWTPAPDGGRVWSLDVTSPGAIGLRIHFTDIALPEGAELTAYNVADWTEIAGPYTGQGGPEGNDVYTPTMFGDRARIELYLPPGAPIAALPFDADNIQHLFRNPLDALTGRNNAGTADGVTITPTVGNCHNDVTCFPAWANTARAVGLYLFSDGGGTGQCTGQLLATQNNDLTPYFLTAAHCVNTAADAASVQVFWLFQTASCNGPAPNQGASPTTTGATLVATRAQSDSTLIRLTGAVPGGLFYAGWTSAPVANGTAAACIHHPDGSWKRISFGTATDQAGCTLGSQSETVDATWTTAVTEGGSSGSGLFRSDTMQLIGTLSCGPSFCGATGLNLHDGYGRFASFYPSIASALAGGADDAFEQNDTCATARALTPVTGTTLTSPGLTVKSTDEDYYKYTLPVGSTLTVTLTFAAASGTVNAQLFTTCGGAVLASASGVGGTRTLTYANTGAADEVYLRVYLTGGTTNTYGMTTLVTTGADACGSATTVTSGNTYAGTTVGATTDGASGCPNAAAARTRPDVWYTFTAPSAGTLQLDTCLSSPTDTVMSVHSGCPGNTGNQLACNDDGLTNGPCGGVANNFTSYLTTPLTSGQTVKIRVSMWDTATGTFVLRVNFVPAALANDTCAGAIAIGEGATPFNTSAALTEATTDTACTFFSYSGVAKDVWYRHTAQCNGNLVVDTCGSSYDTKLAIYAACPAGNNTALDCDDDANPACGSGTLHSRVTTAVTSGTVYYIRVGGYRNAGGAETSGAGVLNIMCNAVTPPCPADLGAQGGIPGQDGVLDNNDFVVFIDYFFSSNPAADVGQQGGQPGSDAAFDNNDFVVFIDLFFAGCP